MKPARSVLLPWLIPLLLLPIVRGPPAGSAEGVPLKQNLDLPAEAIAVAPEEEEAPEVIFFYGQQFEGDGFFFCVDRSGSMRNGEFAIAQRELIRIIGAFSERVQFALVFFDSNIMVYPPAGGSSRPLTATMQAKAAAIAYVLAIQTGSGTCVARGLQKTLEIANRAETKRNLIVLLCDGYTTCPGVDSRVYAAQTLEQVAAGNFRRIPIHSVVVGADVSETFPKQLAEQNQGTYTRIPR